MEAARRRGNALQQSEALKKQLAATAAVPHRPYDEYAGQALETQRPPFDDGSALEKMRSGEIPTLLKQLDDRVETMTRQAAILFSRLEPVIRNVPEAVPDPNSIEPERDLAKTNTELGRALASVIMRLEALNNGIARVSTLVEL